SRVLILSGYGRMLSQAHGGGGLAACIDEAAEIAAAGGVEVVAPRLALIIGLEPERAGEVAPLRRSNRSRVSSHRLSA
ncbi:MAG TPA: hypothetical protein VG167_09175, partial [Verrucomicrobiae bacterium]|nr:hypothetical protein [Verrucomicrobiae bacterium]